MSGCGQFLFYEYWFHRHVNENIEKSNLIPLNLVVSARLTDAFAGVTNSLRIVHNYSEINRIGSYKTEACESCGCW